MERAATSSGVHFILTEKGAEKFALWSHLHDVEDRKRREAELRDAGFQRDLMPLMFAWTAGYHSDPNALMELQFLMQTHSSLLTDDELGIELQHEALEGREWEANRYDRSKRNLDNAIVEAIAQDLLIALQNPSKAGKEDR